MSFRKLDSDDTRLPAPSVTDEELGLCQDCDGYGNIIENGVARACHCRIERELRERMAAARVPERYRDCSFKNYISPMGEQKKDLKNLVDIAQQMVQSPGLGLYLHGEHGTGKTHLAIGVLRELIRHGREGVYYNVVDMLDQMRDSMRADAGPGGQQLLGFHMQWDIVLLDDLGVQRASPWVVERLHAIINARYETGRTLIITSNKKLEEATANLNRAITSRLREMCIPYEMLTRQDYRNRPTPTRARRATRTEAMDSADSGSATVRGRRKR